jgi:hypothetical protein
MLDKFYIQLREGSAVAALVPTTTTYTSFGPGGTEQVHYCIPFDVTAMDGRRDRKTLVVPEPLARNFATRGIHLLDDEKLLALAFAARFEGVPWVRREPCLSERQFLDCRRAGPPGSAILG